MNESVFRPDHYKRFIIDPVTFATANGLSFIEGNIIKYVCRAPHKNRREDLLKARRYIDMLIETMDREERITSGESPDDVWKNIL